MPESSNIDFILANEPVSGLVTKFGGQPTWLLEPLIPRSRRTMDPMTFVGQVVIPRSLCPDDQLRLAYIFMTGSGFDHRAMETWNPADGETAVIIQRSAGTLHASAPYPAVLKRWQECSGSRQEVPCECRVIESPASEAEYLSLEELLQLPESEGNRIAESWRGNKIGGSPYWLQGEEFPFPEARLLLQLEDGTYPFSLNLGTGFGYVFVDRSCSEAVFLSQC